MMKREPDNSGLKKYAQAGRLMTSQAGLDDHAAQQALLDLLNSWSETLEMPILSAYGVTESDIPKIIANISGGSMAGNPIRLTEEEVKKLIQSRL